jgi:tetratricopeptide (TPR) repeat protein
MKLVVEKSFVLSLVIFFGILANSAFAQTKTSTPTVEDKRVMAIYEATKTVKSAKDYTHMLDACEQLLAGELSAKHRSYVTSLTGWALNRRGGLRLETAEQLKLVGNAQADQAMAQAMSDFDEAIKADPKRWRSWLSRGIAYVSQQKLELAVEDFNTVIELKPDEFKAWFNRGEANYYRGEFEQAIADYGAMLEMKENDLLALTSRGHAYFALAKFPEALADYELVNKLLPDNCETQINLGDVYQKLGRWQKAEEAYKQAIKIDPTSIALQRFAWLKATCPDATYRDAGTAKELIDQAIALGEESPVLLDTLAAVQAANGEFDIAKQTQQQAIQLATSLETPGQGGANTEYQTRMAMYEEGVPYQQDK